MRQFYDLDPAPLKENCLPAGHEKSYEEAYIFVEQVRRAYPPPFGAKVYPYLNDHDICPYYSVRLMYNDVFDEHMDWFYDIDNDESQLLQTWDETSIENRKEMGI